MAASAASGASVVEVVTCPGFCLKLTLPPGGLMAAGLITGAPGSRARTAFFGALVVASDAIWPTVCALVSDCGASWDSSLPGAFVVGRPRLRLMFNLLKAGRAAAAPFAEAPPFDGVDAVVVVVVVDTEVLLAEGARNLPRPDTGFSAFTELDVSFCMVSSSIGLKLPPGRGRLNPLPLKLPPPKRPLTFWVGSDTVASVLVLLPPLDLKLIEI